MGPDHLILFIILRYIQHYPKNSDWPKYFWVAGYILVWLEPATNHSRCDYPRGHDVVGLGPRFWSGHGSLLVM